MWLSTLKFCTHPASPPLEGPDLVFIPSPRRFFFSSSSFSSGGGEARRRGAERRQTEAGGPRVVDFGTPGGGRERKGCRCAAGQAAGRGRPGRGRPGGGRPPRGSPGRRPRGAASVQLARPALDLRRAPSAVFQTGSARPAVRCRRLPGWSSEPRRRRVQPAEPAASRSPERRAPSGSRVAVWSRCGAGWRGGGALGCHPAQLQPGWRAGSGSCPTGCSPPPRGSPSSRRGAREPGREGSGQHAAPTGPAQLPRPPRAGAFQAGLPVPGRLGVLGCPLHPLFSPCRPHQRLFVPHPLLQARGYRQKWVSFRLTSGREVGEEEDASRVKGGGQSGARGLVSRLRNPPLQPVGPRSRSWLSVLGGLSESVMQTHAAGKVVTRNGGQLVLRCLVWCLSCSLQLWFLSQALC